MNRILDMLQTDVLLEKGFRNIGGTCLFYLFFIMVLFTSCAKEFRNPYDPATPPDIWMPKAFKLDTLGTNALRISWNQDERHIDGFAIQKSTNGQIKEILLPLDSLRFTDTQVVDTSSDEVCPELSYKVMARAGNNRSLDVGTTSGIIMPLSTFSNAGLDQTNTSNLTQVTLAANSPAADETGTWSIVSGAGGSFTNVNSPIANFAGNACTNYILRWTIQGNCSSDFDEVSILFQQTNTITNAGADQTIASNLTQVTLAANSPAADETGIWSIVSGEGGIFSNSNSPTSTFSGNACTNYILRWTIDGTCSTDFDDINISFQQSNTIANAGSDQSITSNLTQVTLAANSPAADEIGTWSIVNGTGGSFSNVNSPSSTFTGNACTSYSLRWTIQGACSPNFDDVSISFQQTYTIANAGANINSSATQVVLSANSAASDETGQWTVISGSGGSFSNVNSPTSTFTGNLCSVYTLRWSIQNTCITTSDDVEVSFNIQTTQAQAGSNQSPSGLSILLNANIPGANESGNWSIVSGSGGSFSNANSHNSQFSGLAGNSYQLRWTINGTCSSTTDDMLATFPANPTGTSFSINNCNDLTGLTSLYYGLNGNSGTWGIGSGGYSGSCLVAPNFNNTGQLSNAIGTHSISFQKTFASSGYVEFWFNTYYAGSPNIMPEVLIDNVQQSAPTIVGGQTTNGSWMKARTSVINSGSHTIKIQFTSQYYVLKVDEIECFQY